VYSALAARGVTIPAGSCPSVGIAGHALGGGMGLAARQFGLTADNLLSAQIVTAGGRLRTASSHSTPDLCWALRGGGGGNFGVVTSLTFRVHPVPRRATPRGREPEGRCRERASRPSRTTWPSPCPRPPAKHWCRPPRPAAHRRIGRDPV
jgi:FAD/FMN-containing dehydrogenase